jgi:hypothetical protein
VLRSGTGVERGADAGKVYRVGGVIARDLPVLYPANSVYVYRQAGTRARGRAGGGADPTACVTTGAAVSLGDFGVNEESGLNSIVAYPAKGG